MRRDRAFRVCDSGGIISPLTGVAEDTTERKLSELRWVHQALYDDLTGFPIGGCYGRDWNRLSTSVEPESLARSSSLDLDQLGVGVAVNVSATQFACPDFVDIVKGTLETTGLPPQLLELELPESVFMRDGKESARTLTKLRNLGVTIALDDFGICHSALSFLQILPLDALKIDRSWLMENESLPKGVAVLQCVVEFP
jgi:hypothetical protein